MNRTAVEAAVRRRAGASADRREAIQEAFNTASDLYARCPKCGGTVRGTLAEVKRQMASHACA